MHQFKLTNQIYDSVHETVITLEKNKLKKYSHTLFVFLPSVGNHYGNIERKNQKSKYLIKTINFFNLNLN